MLYKSVLEVKVGDKVKSVITGEIVIVKKQGEVKIAKFKNIGTTNLSEPSALCLVEIVEKKDKVETVVIRLWRLVTYIFWSRLYKVRPL